MEITRETVMSLLIAGHGRVESADLLRRFKGSFDSSDPAEKKSNRELFKRIVNHYAVVKEIDGVKYIVLKTKYGHLLTEGPGKGEHDEPRQAGEHTPARSDNTVNNGDEGGGGSVYSASASAETQLTASPVSGANSEEKKHHSPADSAASAIELALQRSSFSDLKVRKALHFETTGQGSDEHKENRSRESATPAPPPPPCVHKTHVPSSTSKRYGLPLRMPPTEIHKLKCISDDPSAERSGLPPETLKGRPPKTPQSHGSPPLPGVQAVKVSKPSQEEPAVRDPRFSSAVPLEPSEHEWLVKSAAGQWSLVYGLLLQDNQLVEKRDFMSGFTALHWAAKSGNSDILAKMIRVSRERGADVDVNARSHGGYTPLHIAALHDQEYVLGMLAGEFKADVRLRDNCGKRAYHYLHGGITGRVRELLGEPRPAQPPPEQEAAGQQQQEREDMDLFQDLSKGLHTISRLFQPHAASTHRKRHKHRPEFYSLSEEPREESE